MTYMTHIYLLPFVYFINYLSVTLCLNMYLCIYLFMYLFIYLFIYLYRFTFIFSHGRRPEDAFKRL